MRYGERTVGWCAALSAPAALTGVTPGAAAPAPVPQPTPTGRPEAAQDIPAGTPAGLSEYLSFSYGNIADYWAAHFRELGLSPPSAFYAIPMAGEMSSGTGIAGRYGGGACPRSR